MKRFLLFDSGCSLCTKLAQSIEKETNNWLQVRSLRDLEMKVLMDKIKPGWEWEPTLIEIDDAKHVEIYTGLKMQTKFIMGLGLRRTIQIAKLVQQSSVAMPTVDTGRRNFIKQGTLGFASLALLFTPSLNLSDFLGKQKNIKTRIFDDDQNIRKQHMQLLRVGLRSSICTL